jgi:hypothetical protein
MAEPPEALIAAIESDESLPEATGGGRYRPLAEAVTRQVRAAILDGRLEPGTRIRQEEIARRLGTINYEVTCGISARVPRRHHRDGVA